MVIFHLEKEKCKRQGVLTNSACTLALKLGGKEPQPSLISISTSSNRFTSFSSFSALLEDSKHELQIELDTGVCDDGMILFPVEKDVHVHTSTAKRTTGVIKPTKNRLRNLLHFHQRCD